jgi:NAD(P)-dependent dehydrogenase (short-subunit alcohol dehydrogenase family)
MTERGWALVTGASRGIGQAISERLGREGFRVATNHFNDPDGAQTTLDRVRAAGGDGLLVAADVGNGSEVQAMFDQLDRLAQPLRVLVNNAGVQTFASLLDLREEDWDRTIRTNLKGTFLCTQQAARRMQTGGGDIINIGSGANRVPFPKLGDYCASKGGIEMLTKVAAVELGRFGIRVNCIAPGAIENERTREEDPTYAATWGNLTPLARVGTMQDVSNAVVLLLNSDASFVTGQTVFVDGGLWMRGQWPYPF